MKYLRCIVKNLKNDEGATFKNGQPITYRSGWQVGLEGIVTPDIDAAVGAIKKYGSCGIWYSEGLYYVDKGKRIATKREALALGRQYNQQSIFGWKTGKLAWC